jgi:hypothetical protein
MPAGNRGYIIVGSLYFISMELSHTAVDSNQRSILSIEVGPKSKSPPLLPNISFISNARSSIGPGPGGGGGGGGGGGASAGTRAFEVGCR